METFPPFNKTDREPASILGRLILTASVLGAVVIWLSSCTVAPTVVHPATINFDGNAQNGGLIDLGPNKKGPARVTSGWIADYTYLAGIYGKDMTPPLHRPYVFPPNPDGTFQATLQQVSDKNVMAGLRDSRIAP
jgi:hypothetical protein